MRGSRRSRSRAATVSCGPTCPRAQLRAQLRAPLRAQSRALSRAQSRVRWRPCERRHAAPLLALPDHHRARCFSRVAQGQPSRRRQSQCPLQTPRRLRLAIERQRLSARHRNSRRRQPRLRLLRHPPTRLPQPSRPPPFRILRRKRVRRRSATHSSRNHCARFRRQSRFPLPERSSRAPLSRPFPQPSRARTRKSLEEFPWARRR